MAEGDDKTEEATPHRLEEAREKGDVPTSREYASFLLFTGMALVMYFYGKSMITRLVDVFRTSIDPQRFKLSTVQEFMGMANYTILEVLWIVGPVFSAVFIFGVAGYLTQIGFLFTTEKVSPDINKINPLNGLQRMFSKDSAVELVKSLLKLAVFASILYFIFRSEISHMNEIGSQPINKSFLYLIDILGKLFLAMLIFLAILGLLDLGWQKWSYAQKMRMSWQEVKEEMKQREGDPVIRSRIRQIQRDQARKRMMEDVPKADVVVTNPTHVAVALKYKRGEMKAPVVVAKGAGHIAVKIKELAAKSGVPIVEKRELARYMYRNVEVGQAIPETLYTAVAEVLAYVYKIKKKFKRMIREAVA